MRLLGIVGSSANFSHPSLQMIRPHLATADKVALPGERANTRQPDVSLRQRGQLDLKNAFLYMANRIKEFRRS
jgi:hypothetical protein